MSFTLLELSLVAGAAQGIGVVTKTIKDVLSEVYKLSPFYKQMTGSTSLTQIASAARVEPITIVSADLQSEAYMDGIMQSLLNIFVAYYMQAVSMSLTVNGVSIEKKLRAFNPDPQTYLSTESYDSGLLDRDAYRYSLPRVSVEAGSSLPMTRASATTGTLSPKDSLEKASNLSVGKLIEMNVTSKVGQNSESLAVPVTVRLATTLMSSRPLADLIVGNGLERDFISRWNKWRDGQIEFIRDLILCQDIIDEQKKLMMNDEYEVYRNILTRINKSRTKYFFSGTKEINLAMASNIYVMSEAVAENIEQQLGLKLSNPRARRKIFENNYAMIIAIVDREWNQVTLYYRGNDVPTQVSIKAMSKDKNKSDDIMEIFKAFTMGNAPVL